MKINTKELTGAALDWAVAKCEGYIATFKPDEVVYAHPLSGEWHNNGNWSPSTKWVQGGPIIEREISKLFKNVGGTYSAQIRHEENHPLISHKVLAGWTNASGPTMLIAAMRCYAASKLGDEIDVPEELLS